MDFRTRFLKRVLAWTILPVVVVVFSISVTIHGLLHKPAYSLYGNLFSRDDAEKSHLIESILDNTLKNIDGAVVARVSNISSHETVANTLPHFTWTVIAARSVRSFKNGPGPLVKNLPITNWSTYLPQLLEGKCSYQLVDDQQESSSRERLHSMGVGAFDVCPIMRDDNFLGALFVFWPEGTDARDPLNYFADMQKAASILAFIIDNNSH
jgi:hypothetical protein